MAPCAKAKGCEYASNVAALLSSTKLDNERKGGSIVIVRCQSGRGSPGGDWHEVLSWRRRPADASHIPNLADKAER
jgi:hypothetical protein